MGGVQFHFGGIDLSYPPYYLTMFQGAPIEISRHYIICFSVMNRYGYTWHGNLLPSNVRALPVWWMPKDWVFHICWGPAATWENVDFSIIPGTGEEIVRLEICVSAGAQIYIYVKI